MNEIIFETLKGSAINTRDSKWVYNFESEAVNIRKAYLTLGATIPKKLVFDGINFDDKPNFLPIEARNAQLFRTLINFLKGGNLLDIDYLDKNNFLSKKYYQLVEPLIIQDYSYTYDLDGKVLEMKFSPTGKINYSYQCN